MKIKNWEVWQSYRSDRGTPPWIKVHRNLFSNPEWAVLSDEEKGQLISLWILAADKSGEIPDDERIIMKLAQLDNPPNLAKFKELNFIMSDGSHLDVNMTPKRLPLDAPETETETDKRQRQKKGARPTIEELQDYFAEKKSTNQEAEKFFDHYSSNGWKVGKNAMKDWKATVRNWIRRNATTSPFGASGSKLKGAAKVGLPNRGKDYGKSGKF